MNNTSTPRTDEAVWIEADVVEASFARQLETELAEVTEQRDAAHEELAGKEDCIDNWMQEAMNFKKQRDELAEALAKIEERYTDGCDTYEDHRFMGMTAKQTLEGGIDE